MRSHSSKVSCSLYRTIPILSSIIQLTRIIQRVESALISSPKSLMLVGELLAYAGRVSATQYRHHLFTLILFARTARLIRWDRTQALVSASFDHRENSDILASILQRFTRMSPFQRGTDPFVTEGEVSFEEVEMLREALKQAPPEVQEHSGNECLGLMVLPGNEDLPLLLLSSKTDVSTTQAPFCHRGSISPPRYAYNTRTRSFVLLLDAFVRKGAAHSDVYTALHQHDVPNVPTLLWQGVVPTNCCNSGVSVYRSAIEVISGLRLESCRDARRLARYFADICQSVEDAGKHGIFHGRICPMNIRLRNGRACLINWLQAPPDDGRLVIDSVEEPELVNYKSIRRLMAAEQTYASLEDDLESVLWVFVQCVLQTFAIESAEQLFRFFMMDPPAYVAQQKKAFLRGAFDDVTFLPEVQWLHDLLCELCEDKAISSVTFRRYGLDDVSICDEEDSSLFSDSEGSTLCAYESESESEGNRRPSGKRKSQNLMPTFTTLRSGRDGITFCRVWR
ncbi:hypothetical protein BDZ89DRAFT_157758 [Hymenopellis radicata]|nr:hypothetical protein BDZ89DRAFT_157758 [Hymenopellis radicata]